MIICPSFRGYERHMKLGGVAHTSKWDAQSGVGLPSGLLFWHLLGDTRTRSMPCAAAKQPVRLRGHLRCRSEALFSTCSVMCPRCRWLPCPSINFIQDGVSSD